ncbi:Pimeloyl-ACP methyl ester carboxylesterase [Ruegeria halocynthiae]|uniref:Pimeloyl-ACP methyl ester carboxylesterase n=1 Tax=Ruegeria halocynthiae TaxID=985054 RepID=A0A1H2WAI8_9RHOB|nr:alpha/beta hydrolase [Ruegeria halocynthiae]SDW77059.1 Pimeloyl-ACP methyl ester carboxylesterase [Ruegeria halocynthiae]
MTITLTIAAVLAGFLLAMAYWTHRLTRQGVKMVPQLGQIVPVKGGSIHYVEKGDPADPTLVMIHGLSGQLQHFTYALVDDLASDFHVLAVDRPGCGYSSRDNAELAALPEQARMIHEFLELKGIANATLIGHSLGGAVALAMALDYPDQTHALALLSPLTQEMPGAPAVFKPLEIRTQWLRNLIGYTIAVPLARKTAPLVLRDVFSPEPAPADFLYRAGGALGLRPSAFITASQDVIGVETSIGALCRRYKDLQVGGGILFGAADPVLAADIHGVNMTQYGLALDILNDRGHMILITAPDICADFIRRVAGKSADEATKIDA